MSFWIELHCEARREQVNKYGQATCLSLSANIPGYLCEARNDSSEFLVGHTALQHIAKNFSPDAYSTDWMTLAEFGDALEVMCAESSELSRPTDSPPTWGKYDASDGRVKRVRDA